MQTNIRLSRSDIGISEYLSVIKCLRKGMLGMGFEVGKFEDLLSNYLNSNVVCVSSGTAALHLALESINLEKGSEVLVPSLTYVATFQAITAAGLIPKSVDIDPNTGNMSFEYLENAISPKTKVVLPVLYAGDTSHYRKIIKWSKDNGLRVVCDAAHAFGSKDKGQLVGSFGDISTWSFCQDKIITTGGEGGMVSTNNEILMDKIWSYKDHGKTRNAVYKKNHKPGFRWLHERIGTNMRMTEIQAAIGEIQLKRLNKWIDLRNRNALILFDYLKDIPCIRIPMPENNIQSAWYKFYGYLEFKNLKSDWDRNKIICELAKQNFPAFHGSCSEIYLEKGLKNYKISNNKVRLEFAQELGKTSLMFLVHPTITINQITNYAENIRKILLKACK